MSRTYVVTGSASGIGACTAGILRDRGDRVIGVDLKDADVEADLSTAEGRRHAVAEVGELAENTIDAIIACAGISAPIPKTVSVNYFGVVELLEGLLPALRRSEAPRVAVVSSMASLQPNDPSLVDALLEGDEDRALAIAESHLSEDPMTGYVSYPASKRALSRWVRRASVSEAWAGSGIPVNAIAPGTVLTPMTKELLSDPKQVEFVDQQVPMPLNYHQPPESVANALIWLTSPENTHMAGQTIYVDGGAEVSLRGDDVWSWND